MSSFPELNRTQLEELLLKQNERIAALVAAAEPIVEVIDGFVGEGSAIISVTAREIQRLSAAVNKTRS